MKILHVITTLQTGGAEKLMVDLLPRLREMGNEVELCVFENKETPFYNTLSKAGIKINCVASASGYYSPLCLLKLVRLMQRGWDIVHTHTTAPQLFAALGGLFCQTHLVTTEHNTTNTRRKLWWYKPIDKWMFRQYEAHIMISDQCEANHRAYLGDANCKNLTMVYNGIDYYKYASAEPAKDVRNLGEKVISFVAAFRPQKDQSTLIKAMEYLPKEFHLCLVGGGNDSRKALFEKMIKERGLQDRVHLLGIRYDMPQVLAASDYVAMSSHFEGLSLASLEGMSSGKPFLASDVDGLHEIVNGNGVLFEHENARTFADEILKLDSDAVYKADVVRCCQAKAIQYDINVMAEKYMAVYTNLVK